jgi:hypothetical protein
MHHPSSGLSYSAYDPWQHWQPDYEAWWRRWQGADTAKPERRRRERRPTLAAALKQASKAGVDVKGATLAADGSVSLTFGEARTEPKSETDRELEEFEARYGKA